MGLFDKKYCDVCGEKIGLLGNRKLEDGNLCKDCAKKLSPFFDDRRHSTVEEIKQQLEYREQNKSAVAQFRAAKSYGSTNKIYVDIEKGNFIVTPYTDWRDENPDVISFSQVTSVDTDIKEHKREIYYRDNEGQQRSYTPRRYEFSYEFDIVILVNSPWFDDIRLELSSFSNRPDSTYSPMYNDLMMQMNEISSLLMGRGMPGGYGQPMGYGQGMGYGQSVGYPPQSEFGAQPTRIGNAPQNPQFNNNAGYSQNVQPNNGNMSGGWMCACGTQNTSNFCQNCGQKKPQQLNWDEIECDKCSWRPEPGQAVPKFCPNCGDPINQEDLN